MTTPTPPGWYPDPSGTPGTRFWDGQAWTDNTQVAPPPIGAPAPPPAQKKHGKCKWFALGLVALIVISAILSLIGSVLCGVGAFVAMPWLSATQGNLLGQTFVEAGAEL